MTQDEFSWSPGQIPPRRVTEDPTHNCTSSRVIPSSGVWHAIIRTLLLWSKELSLLWKKKSELFYHILSYLILFSKGKMRDGLKSGEEITSSAFFPQSLIPLCWVVLLDVDLHEYWSVCRDLLMLHSCSTDHVSLRTQAGISCGSGTNCMVMYEESQGTKGHAL